jgi:short-subunit dehydrogenase
VGTPAFPFRTALVTGASSGIGEVMVGMLADAGVVTIAVARRLDRLQALAERHPNVEVLVADLTDSDDLAVVAARVADVDLVVNNAGFGTGGLFHELDADRLDREIELNIASLTRLSHAALAAMVPRGRGWLLNVASVAGFQPAPRLAVYAATKAYVLSLSESLHEEVRGNGVVVTALCPGLTRTEFQQVSNMGGGGNRENMPSVAWTSVELVARTGLDDVAAGKPISVPGPQYKLMTALAGVTPRWIKRKASARVPRD